ncbi:rodlin [Streptomyces sp. AF1A]|uniref:rodlin n=1 Tax=Streptomyces sp. AF1A TaxID=3394350 RepID=UPI0039BC5729
MKKLWATAAVAVSVAGLAGVAAPQALAIGNDQGTTALSGNATTSSFGNSATLGDMSPQLSLVQGSLNKPCVGLPTKVNTQSALTPASVGVQDLPVLSSPQTQECTENSTQAKGDEPLSHLLDDVTALSRVDALGS